MQTKAILSKNIELRAKGDFRPKFRIVSTGKRKDSFICFNGTKKEEGEERKKGRVCVGVCVIFAVEVW